MKDHRRRTFLMGFGVALAATILIGFTAPTAGAEEKDKECPYAGHELTPEKLKPILDAHAAWRKDREGKGAKRAVLCKANLIKADLQGADLREANLQKAVLSGAKLQGAKLYRADLREADLRGADLQGADLVQAKLQGADLVGAKLQKAVLRRADLQKAVLRAANLQAANLVQAKLQGADLREAKLQNADLRDAKLQKVELGKADLREAKLFQADLQGADLREAKLQNAVLRKADLQGADLREAKLQNADLRDAKLQNSDLRESKLQNADLRKAKLIDADLQVADLSAANLQNAILEAANLQDAKFQEADLRGANLQYTKLAGADFLKAKLNNASLLGVDFDDLKIFEPLGPEDFPKGLVSVREKFKIAGDRKEERYLTFLIKRNERRKAPGIESAFSYILFEATSDWGYAPGRPLKILGGLILIFGLFYLNPIAQSSRKFGKGEIYMILPEDRLMENSGGNLELAEKSNFEQLLQDKVRWIFWYALYFSLLSAFHIGWRDLNVGSWIARLQSREYTMRPRGWVRIVSGIQSLISVYLLALWALVYFARPFE